MRRAQVPQIPPVGTTEAELIQRARNRDEAAVRAIMQSNNRRLYRIARGESEAVKAMALPLRECSGG